MKTKNLLLTLLALASFSLADAGTLYICGPFQNNNDSVWVHIEFNDNGTIKRDSVLSDPNGNFSDFITVSTSRGFARRNLTNLSNH